MFESDDKKYLKNKYNKMQGIGAATGRNLNKFGNLAGEQSSSVYGELKLSEKLANELNAVKDHVDSLNEKLEEALYERDIYKHELAQMKKKLQLKHKELIAQKDFINQMKQLNNQTIIKCEQMIRSSAALTKFVAVSERYRKKFSEKLRDALSKKDQYENEIFELEQNKKLFQIQSELVEGKLEMIHESVGKITDAKNLEDKYKIEIKELKEKNDTLQKEYKDIESQ